MKNIDTFFGSALGGIKVTAFLLLILVLSPVALIFKRRHPDDPFRIPKLFHRCVLKLLGIRVRVIGEPSTASPVLFASNHVSYLDINVLGSMLAAGFVAKAEVADWPLFGFMARVQNTVFIERRSTRVGEQRTLLQDYLKTKKNLILFPEGTSSDGLTALPFKSSLFSIVEDSAEGTPITVQPVSITCTELNGFLMLREERPLYAWYGDMTMVPHLWNVFKRGGFTVEVIFHDPIGPSEGTDRKALALRCQEAVARGIAQSLGGRSV